MSWPLSTSVSDYITELNLTVLLKSTNPCQILLLPYKQKI